MGRDLDHRGPARGRNARLAEPPQNGEKVDFSLLLDGLQAEREQGITIDIAWRYFETTHRRFVVIDAPGHEQYTRNMATGASHADVAILLVDARHGAKRQTRRHAAICDLVGIKRVVLAVNKMDEVDWSEARYRQIEAEFHAMAGSFSFAPHRSFRWPPCPATMSPTARRPCPGIPVPTLLDYLETRSIPRPSPSMRRSACRCNSCCAHGDFRGYSGTVTSGRIRLGERIVDARSGLGATLRRITTMDGDRSAAVKGDAVTLVLDTDLDISRGAVLSEVPRPADQRRRDRDPARLAAEDAVRSRSRLSAADGDRSHAGHEHERFGAGRFRDASWRNPPMPAPSTTLPIAASCSAGRHRSISFRDLPLTGNFVLVSAS